MKVNLGFFRKALTSSFKQIYTFISSFCHRQKTLDNQSLVRKILISSFILNGLSFSQPCFADKNQSKNGWQVLSDEDGFVTKKKKSTNSDILIFRGETTVDVPISKILSVFFDRSRRKDWVNRFGGQEDLEVRSRLDKVYWIRFKLPFFMSDRDYVLQLKAEARHKSREMIARIQSVEHPSKGLDNCCIRARAFGTFYRFLAQGKKTYLEVEVQTDPKGWIPTWLTNLIQKNWPKKTLKALIAAAQQENVKADPEFTAWETAKP